jgi:glycosyltransferase involved in cell wall biosynthesis
MHKERIGDSKVAIHSLGDLKGIHPLLIVRVHALVRRIRPEILQTWLPQMDIIGGLVARWNSMQWILSERSSEVAYQRTPALAWLRGRLARHAKAVVANSVGGAEYWKRIVPADHAVITVNNGIDFAAIRGAAPISCQDSGDRGQTVLFVGRFEHYKASEIFLQAIRHMSHRHNVRALLMGDGPLLQEVRDNITSLNLETHVRIMPYRADWWGLLKTATALISPSRFEGQPNVVLEAMAAGCPLIVSDIPAHRVILDEKSALIVPKDNPAALAGAIESLLSDPEAARERAERAFERVAGFTIQASADAYERVYARVLTGRHS